MKDNEQSSDGTEETVMTLEKYIQVLTTDDGRLTIIGEELSNKTGRAILAKLFENVSSIAEISSRLGISMTLTKYHIQRMLQVGLISEGHIQFSKKNKIIQHYAPSKLAIIIIPTTQNPEIYPEILKHSLKKIYKYLAGFAAFIASTTILHGFLTSQQRYQMSDPAPVFSISSEILSSLLIGTSVGFGTWILLKLYEKKRN